MVPAQGAKLEMSAGRLLPCMCPRWWGLHKSGDVPYKADRVTRRMEAGSALRESGMKDEGMAPHKKHPHRNGSAGRATGDWTQKRDCSKEDLAAVTQLRRSEKECEREEERGFPGNQPILTLKPKTGSIYNIMLIIHVQHADLLESFVNETPDTPKLPQFWSRPKCLSRNSSFQFAHSSSGVEEHKKGNAGVTQNDWTGYGASQKSGTHTSQEGLHS